MYRRKHPVVLSVVFACAAVFMLCLCGCASDTPHQSAQSAQVKSVPAGTVENANINVVDEAPAETELLTTTKDESSPADWSCVIHDNETGVDYLMIGEIGSYSNCNSDIVVRLGADGKPFVTEPVSDNVAYSIVGESSQYYVLYRTKLHLCNLEVIADKTTGVEYIVNTSDASICPRVDAEGNPLVMVME